MNQANGRSDPKTEWHDQGDVDLEAPSAIWLYRVIATSALGMLLLMLSARLPGPGVERTCALALVLLVPPWLAWRRGESWGAMVVVLTAVALAVDRGPDGRPIPHLRHDSGRDWLVAATLILFLMSYFRLLALEFNPLAKDASPPKDMSRWRRVFYLAPACARIPNPRPVGISEVVLGGLMAAAAPLVWLILSTLFVASLGSQAFFGLPTDLSVGLLAAVWLGLTVYFLRGLWWEWRRRSAGEDLARFELQMVAHRELRSELALLERARLRRSRRNRP